MSYSLNALYRVAGISKQAVWEHFQREHEALAMIRRVMVLVDERRAEHPGAGLEKLYWQIRPDGMGRDKFCHIFGTLGYGVQRPTTRMRTTIPAHTVFENLIEGRLVNGPCQVWQSDITYFTVGELFYYLTFLLDVYTRRIVGYAVSKSLRAEANLQALTMALGQYSTKELNGCVHHSDRGSQYTDGRYLQQLRAAGMPISMGGRATENAFVERIHGVIKHEYLLPWAPDSYQALVRQTARAVADYNTKRHHGALGRRCPHQYEQDYWQLPKAQRKVEMIRSENTPYISETRLQNIPVDTLKKTPYCMVAFH